MKFLDRADVEAVARSIFGGAAKVRDVALLESAVMRAQNAYSYLDVSIFDAASYYAVGIVKNHPFADGNKRIAWVACTSFLRLNAIKVIGIDQDRAAACMIAVADGEMTREFLAGFLAGAAEG